MWLISLRDLQWRRRRFVVAVLAAALVFCMTLLLSGAGHALHAQDDHIVSAFGAERWVVADGASGPFTASRLIPPGLAARALSTSGLRRAGPMVIFRTTADAPGAQRDVNLIGYQPGALGTPAVDEGRPALASGEIVADALLRAPVGRRIVVGGRPFRVVGVSRHVTYYFGTPTVLMTVTDAQRLVFAGQPYLSALAVRGAPAPVPAGLRVVTNDAARADLRRPTKTGDQTIGIMSTLLWLVAAGIIGSIVYLSALERSRDVAVMKATGASSGSLFAGLALQAVLLSVTAAAVSAGLAVLLVPTFPFPVAIPAGAYLRLLLVAAGVGLAASTLGLRRTLRIDPAMAFGAA